MRHLRTLAYTVTAFALALFTGACSQESPTGPSAPTRGIPTANPSILSDALNNLPQVVEGARRVKPLAADLVVTAQIGASGGSLKLKDAGFELKIPKGAVTKTTTFQVRALAGPFVAYEFEPHGTSFPVPLEFKQELKQIDLSSVSTSGQPQLGYFADRSQLIPLAGIAVVTEVSPMVTITDVTGKEVKGNIKHFSGYMVSSGRR